MSLQTRLLQYFAAVLTTINLGAKEQWISPAPTDARGTEQARIQFENPMVAFGDPNPLDPFILDCPASGHGTWADPWNWIFDFDRPLPGGIKCSFRPKIAFRDLAGSPPTWRSYSFSTGAPAFHAILPEPSDYETISEDQVFILRSWTRIDSALIAKSAQCHNENNTWKSPVQVLGSAQIKAWSQIPLSPVRSFLHKENADKDRPLYSLALRCQSPLPSGRSIALKLPIAMENFAGELDQGNAQGADLIYQVREPLRARMSCTKVNPKAGCVPFLGLDLYFSAPISAQWAAQIRLMDSSGKILPGLHWDSTSDIESLHIDSLPRSQRLKLWIPPGLVDLEGRPLVNAKDFPLLLRSDQDPALAKFNGRFGILEAKNPILPLSLRNVENRLNGRKVSLSGQELKLGAGSDAKIRQYYQLLDSNRRNVNPQDTLVLDGEYPLLRKNEGSAFQVERTLGDQNLELVGIPLKDPGFYILEVQSPRLGRELLMENKPYYIQTGVLVTNLSIHLKLGTTGGLAWVTSLDQGLPQAGVQLRATDCQGRTLWQGQSDAQGTAALPGQIERNLKCPLMVSAVKGNDYSFVMSDWDQGLSPWNFLGGGYYEEDKLSLYNANGNLYQLFHIALDRTLFRAGETLHFKSWMRTKTAQGLELPNMDLAPGELVIQHLGSEQEFPLELNWHKGSALGEWEIPQNAPSGTYQLLMAGNDLGMFRVEEFRVPLMGATIQAPTEILSGTPIPLDLEAHYLNGGGAGDLDLDLRAQWTPSWQNTRPSSPLYRSFEFGNGRIDTNSQNMAWIDEDAEYSEDRIIQTRKVRLDSKGQLQIRWDSLVPAQYDQDLLLQMEYRDPSGAVQYSYRQIQVIQSQIITGAGGAHWNSTHDTVTLYGAALNRKNLALSGIPLQFSIYRTTTQSHRKRLFGGFYGYDNQSFTQALDLSCSGTTDADGIAQCKIPLRAQDGLEFEVRSQDKDQRSSYAHGSIWSQDAESWYAGNDNDRIDLIPAQDIWQIGDTAKFQVRAPFRHASLLVTIEREGILQHFVTEYDSQNPYIQFPITEQMGPNAYVSALLIRGRLEAPDSGLIASALGIVKDLGSKIGLLEPAYTPATGTVDLAKPSFKMGLCQFKVDLSKQKLQVQIQSDKAQYSPRDSVELQIQVKNPQGPLGPDAEIALAVVDEGLLQLSPNPSWEIWENMFPLRALEVNTSTAQSLVIGKRHFGRKTLAPGGGGGTAPNRELFETLQYWNGRIALDPQGRAKIKFRLGDALTAFRVVAMASQGSTGFGTGSMQIRSAQGLSILSGLPPTVRAGDQMDFEFTLRNSTSVDQKITAQGQWGLGSKLSPLDSKDLPLYAQSAGLLSWNLTIPESQDSLRFNVKAQGQGFADQLTRSVKIVPYALAQVQQSTLLQLKTSASIPVLKPAHAKPGLGGVRLLLSAKLGDQLQGVQKYMRDYPYRCMEQQISRATALNDSNLWAGTLNELPVYLDSKGLVRFFPSPWVHGSEILSAYVLTMAQLNGQKIPQDTRDQIIQALIQFVKNPKSLDPYSSRADLSLRRLTVLAALARYQKIDPSWLGGLAIRPDQWPSSALLDWIEICMRSPQIPNANASINQALQELRKRYRYQGGAILWTGEDREQMWWLMSDPDVNSLRMFMLALQVPSWQGELPQMAQGLLLRQDHGHWSSTVANAWGSLAMRAFAQKFEKNPVSGQMVARYGGQSQIFDWKQNKGSLDFPWTAGADNLELEQRGSGSPWITLQSLAMIESPSPRDLGYQIQRSITPLRRAHADHWSVGDLYQVELKIRSKADMAWVALEDPIPSGSSILGSGLGGDRSQSPDYEGSWPAWEEKTSVHYRAFYAWMPKGLSSLRYTVRIGQRGLFKLPPSRIEAMYLTNMFGEWPASQIRVK